MSEGVWLMRHGALPPNPERRFVGQGDIALSETGRRQARSWRRRLADIPFAAIVSSDLSRCVESARLIRGQRELPLVLEPALREISLGAWEGLTPDEVEQRFPGAYAERGRDMARFRPEGGESFADVASRVLPAFGRLAVRYPGQPVLMVGHAGSNRVLLAHRLALPLQKLLDIPQPYACCTVLVGTTRK
jgi:probable phosphoglycerate mutase